MECLPKLIMLVGLPGSGKSTYGEQLKQQGYQIHSSDALREEWYGNMNIQGNANEIFQELHRRIQEDLKKGNSCVYDATNMGRKLRVAFLNTIRKIPCIKTCVVFAIPVDVCKERNQKRTRTVSNHVYDKMLQNFQCPCKQEGWDEIKLVYCDICYGVPFEQMVTFKQDNPHHTLTLGGHIDAVRRYCEEKNFSWRVQKAAAYHDCGKLYTKTFYNAKGEWGEIAHFYGHENYSAYLFITDDYSKELCRKGQKEDVLYIANLINWHMCPLTSWNSSAKARNRDIKFMGEEFYEELMRLHEADVEGH